MTSSDRDRAIATWLRGRIDEGRMPGGVWWVGGRDRPASVGAVGWAALEPEPEPARLDTLYDLASLTKPLATATLAVLLDQDGVIGLDDRCTSLLPEFRGGPYADVTLADLATHRSGLPAWRPLYVEARGREAVVRTIAAEPPDGARGAALYSDLGYLALGVAIERAAGSDLARLFRERVAAPLGLQDIGYGVDSDRAARVAPTERGNVHERALAGERGRRDRFRRHLIRGAVHDGNAHALGGTAGHAGLFGTAEEVARIALAWLADGPLGLEEGSRRRILRPANPGGERTVGLVLARASGAARGILPDDAPGHLGFTGTSLWIVPERGQVAVLLTNRVHPEVDPGDFQDVRRGFHARALATVPPPADPAARGLE